MSPLAFSWRCFSTISSDAEAACYAEYCLFSLATLQVVCDPPTENFALVEQQGPEAWRWAVISVRGVILDGGDESTLALAREIASSALHQRSGATANSLVRSQ